MKKKIKIIIATHKKYQMPEEDIYVPVQVGAEGKDDLGYTLDNSGDNISNKNSSFCELTGMYWAWKNLDADYIGLAHYRRHFSKKKKSKDKFKNIITEDEVKMLLKNNDVILPKKRKYVIENLYDHYAHTMFIEPLDEAGKIIKEKYPEYTAEFEKLHKRTSAHMFNMFIMKKDIFDGRVSELLLDVYLRTNNISYVETNFIYMEKINKIKKVISFLNAKFKGEKYGKSF